MVVGMEKYLVLVYLYFYMYPLFAQTWKPLFFSSFPCYTLLSKEDQFLDIASEYVVNT